MVDNALDALARSAGSRDRRTSLKALGAAAVGAALAGSHTAEARKRGKKRKKRCRREKKQCRRAVKRYCRGVEPDECRADLLPCCRSCKVKNGVFCVVGLIQ